jgi:lipopolysaccharide transport system permease protein/teichoic acid transport system permease protein
VGLFLAAFGVVPGWQIVYLPLIILVQFLSLIALSLFIAYITVFIRDIDNILSHIMRIFFYASPIIWPGGRLPDKYVDQYGWIVDYNPIAIIVNSYRDVLINHASPNLLGLLIIGVLSLILGGYMTYHYSKNEHKIIKAL